MSLRRFISALSPQDHHPHSLSSAADTDSVRRRFFFCFCFCACAAEKIKDSLTWGETLHKEAWRPHVCGLPLCCCHSSLWWVKCHFDLTFLVFSLSSTMSLIFVNVVCAHLAAGISGECPQRDIWTSGEDLAALKTTDSSFYDHFRCCLIFWGSRFFKQNSVLLFNIFL